MSEVSVVLSSGDVHMSERTQCNALFGLHPLVTVLRPEDNLTLYSCFLTTCTCQKSYTVMLYFIQRSWGQVRSQTEFFCPAK